MLDAKLDARHDAEPTNVRVKNVLVMPSKTAYGALNKKMDR